MVAVMLPDISCSFPFLLNSPSSLHIHCNLLLQNHSVSTNFFVPINCILNKMATSYSMSVKVQISKNVTYFVFFAYSSNRVPTLKTPKEQSANFSPLLWISLFSSNSQKGTSARCRR